MEYLHSIFFTIKFNLLRKLKFQKIRVLRDHIKDILLELIEINQTKCQQYQPYIPLNDGDWSQINMKLF